MSVRVKIEVLGFNVRVWVECLRFRVRVRVKNSGRVRG